MNAAESECSRNEHIAALMQLLRTTRELAALQELDDVLRSVTAGVREALGCERASLFLHDEDRSDLYTRVVTELEIAEIRVGIESGIAGWVAQRRCIANIPYPHDDPRWNAEIDRRTGFTTRNILAAPLISQRDGRLVGVLQLLNKSNGGFSPFDEELLEAFAAHAASALERAELIEESRRSHAMRADINVAHRIQKSFLPETLPDVPGYDIAAWWEPAEQVSGDYYDVFPLPDGCVGLVVADVCGHGVAASLLMASARAMLRVLTATLSDPETIVNRLSESILPSLSNGRFVTLLFVSLNPATHEVRYANAGHGPAFLFRSSTKSFETLAPGGLPLGFFEDLRITPGRPMTMRPGDRLVLGTDGVIETLNAEKELFGSDELQRIAGQQTAGSAQAVLNNIREAVLKFTAAPQPEDDITLMIVQRR